MKKRELLIIDAQNDFCRADGALYVRGAEEDCRRMARFIKTNSSRISRISLTLDSHHLHDIAHPLFWRDEEGKHPAPFTIISSEDVENNVWKTSREDLRETGLSYVRNLEKRGRYSLCIWPPHCLIGSAGTQVDESVFRAVLEWESENFLSSRKIRKGDNQATEHYGAFEAEVPDENDVSTALNIELIARLDKADEIIVAGEALDYCVANTVRQLAENLPSGDCGKIVLLKDCCSSVDPSSGLSDSFLKELKERGMRTALSTDPLS